MKMLPLQFQTLVAHWQTDQIMLGLITSFLFSSAFIEYRCSDWKITRDTLI